MSHMILTLLFITSQPSLPTTTYFPVTEPIAPGTNIPITHTPLPPSNPTPYSIDIKIDIHYFVENPPTVTQYPHITISTKTPTPDSTVEK